MAAGQLTLYGAQQVLGSFFGKSTAPPANFYFALCTAVPTPSMNGSEIIEPPSASNYSRLAIANDTVHWATSANAPYVMTAQTMYWPIGTIIGASADWPPCPGWALCDALTAGNLLAVGSLATPVATPLGFCAYLGAGTLSLELSPFYQVQTS